MARTITRMRTSAPTPIYISVVYPLHAAGKRLTHVRSDRRTPLGRRGGPPLHGLFYGAVFCDFASVHFFTTQEQNPCGRFPAHGLDHHVRQRVVGDIDEGAAICAFVSAVAELHRHLYVFCPAHMGPVTKEAVADTIVIPDAHTDCNPLWRCRGTGSYQ
jgi:hypothetical protein